MVEVTKVKTRWSFGPLLSVEQMLALPDNSLLMPSNSGPLAIKYKGALYQLRHHTIPGTFNQPSFSVDLMFDRPIDMTDKYAPTRFLDFGVKPVETNYCSGYWNFLTITLPRPDVDRGTQFPCIYHDHGICYADGSFPDDEDDRNGYMVHTISPDTFKTSNQWNDAGLYGRVNSTLLVTSTEIKLTEINND